MKYDALITDLPISVSVRSEIDLGEEYAKELSSINTEDELEAFTIKWKALWRLPFEKDVTDLSESEESIVDNTYDKGVALGCIKDGRINSCEHMRFENPEQCPGVNILLPPILLKCFMLAQHCGAPVNVVLVQLQKGLDNLPDHIAEHVF